MKTKTKRPTRLRRPQKLKPGQAVVAEAGALEGAGPMDRLIVTKTHSDGTVDLEATTGIAWERVDPEPLLTVD